MSEQTKTHIGPRPPQDGGEWDCQCARCGSLCEYNRCDECEDGFDGHDCGEDCCCCLYPEDNVVCQFCDGYGGWHRCISSSEWCKANPLPGREETQRGTIEWYLTPAPASESEGRREGMTSDEATPTCTSIASATDPRAGGQP